MVSPFFFFFYSETSLSGHSEIGTTSIQWTNSKALIDYLQELIRSVSLKVDPPNSKQWTKAGAASNKFIENERNKAASPEFLCPSLFVKLNEQKSRIKKPTK